MCCVSLYMLFSSLELDYFFLKIFFSNAVKNNFDILTGIMCFRAKVKTRLTYSDWNLKKKGCTYLGCTFLV